MRFTNLGPSDVTFKEELSLSESTQVLLVDIRGHTCVMKVHRHRPRSKAPQKRIDVHVCERKAYERLSQHTLCDLGLVPKFYGVIDNINVKLWQPLLASFLNKEYPQRHYPGERAEAFVRVIQEIHKAGVLDFDPHSRNMIVFDDDPERVMWIDFDRAQVDDGVFFTPETL